MNAQLEAADRFARVAQELLAPTDAERTLQRIVETAVKVVPGCDYAGISVRRGRRVETPAATDESVNRADELQYELDEGPCLDALRRHETFVSEDLARDTRWPLWSPRAAGLGFLSILSVPLPAANGVVAGLNLYGGVLGAFTDDDVRVAGVYARHAAVALEVTQRVGSLEAAMSTRHVIGLAQGILMQRFGLEVDVAFNLLRRLSQGHNRKLVEIAREVVEGNLDRLLLALDGSEQPSGTHERGR